MRVPASRTTVPSERGIEAAEHYMDLPYDRESFVRARIIALAEYMNRSRPRERARVAEAGAAIACAQGRRAAQGRTICSTFT